VVSGTNKIFVSVWRLACLDCGWRERRRRSKLHLY